MQPEQFEKYIRNLIEMDLVDPNALLILFGGEFLDHPESTEIFRTALRAKRPEMKLVIITAGKYMQKFTSQVDEIIRQKEGVSHWEVSIKDFESFQFGLKLLKEGHNVAFRYDYLGVSDLKHCINLFFQNVRSAGLWRPFLKYNPKCVKELRYVHKLASQHKDIVILKEFYCPSNNGREAASAALTFSCLDRSAMRIGSSKAEAKCSLFNPVYQKAIHISGDGTIYPCHLPRYKKRCQALGNAADTAFLKTYKERIEQFREAVRRVHTREICIDGCRGKISYEQ
ncbi:MAG: hypothetical protein DDT19_00416 [Syntrophomonadaceae bacterium]|nr:hypothetical protein [Bacillota bacterium]